METRWAVMRQRETYGRDDSTDQFVRVVEVTFRLANGTVATVNVPTDAYTADEVRRRIDAYADHLEAVAQLGSVTP